MTEKLYCKNNKMRENDADVVSVEKKDGKYRTVLDKTCFFPEGGGQQSDTGFIRNTAVLHVEEVDGVIYHISADKPDFTVGDTVRCRIDWEKRFARMQAHSGEHIVSGIVYKLFGFENVGFHMDDTLMTVDFSGYLTKEQLKDVECAANRAVYENVPINTFYAEQRPEITDCRSKLPTLRNPRLVEIAGYDICACCAPHVSQTGEIGIIKILSSASHRGGVRITLICGKTAYDELSARYSDILRLSDMLCAPHGGVPDAVSDLIVRNEALKRELSLQKEAVLKRIADATEHSDGNLCVFADGLNSDDVRKLAVMLRDRCEGLCVVLSGNDDTGYAFAITSPGIKLRAVSKEINSALSGRGGGKDDMLQGRFAAKRHDIEQYFSAGEFGDK